MRDKSGIEIKTPEQIAAMRRAGLVVAHTLRVLREAVKPGISTADLDALAAREIRGAGATPSFLNEGDIISIDCGAIVDGWHGDAAITVGVGEISPELTRLLEVGETALWHGLAQVRAGGRLTDVSHAVEASVRGAGPYGIIEEYVGHGIGSAMHMDPPVPNYGRPGRGPRLREGMALAVEPMIVLGQPETAVLEDDWTVVSVDGSYAAHFEHTAAITPDGPWVTTAEDGGQAGFAAIGQPITAQVG